jgi:very-short-patch-repair endonuclease
MLNDLIRRKADDQGGYISHTQLREIGLTQSAIKHRIARGFLIVEYDEVYAVGHRPRNPLNRAHGVLVACGPESGLCHESAASVWQVSRYWSIPFHVSTPVRRRLSGIRTHHRTALTDGDFTIEQGLRVTTPALTAFDLAPTLTRKRLVRVVNTLRLANGLELQQLEDLLRRFPRHPGARAVREMLASAPKHASRSGAEDHWPAFAAAYGLSGWETNVFVGPYEVDVLFGPDLLIVEIDGPSHELAVDEDRNRDADIWARFKIPTLRVPVHDYESEPAEQAARIHQILAARRARAA